MVIMKINEEIPVKYKEISFLSTYYPHDIVLLIANNLTNTNVVETVFTFLNFLYNTM